MSGFFVQHSDTKSRNLLLKFAFFGSSGGGLFGIKKIAYNDAKHARWIFGAMCKIGLAGRYFVYLKKNMLLDSFYTQDIDT